MITLRNRQVAVVLDDRWPRTVKLTRLKSGASVQGCDPSAPFALELNGVRYGPEALRSRLRRATRTAAEYEVTVPALGLTLVFRFALEGCELVLALPEVRETGRFRLEKLYVPDHRLVTGTAAAGDLFLRHVTRRRNWAAAWCPGTATYDQWEDWGEVGGATPERGSVTTNHACVWNAGLCAAVTSSVWVEPLVTGLSAEGSAKSGRAGTFGIWAGTYSHRLRGRRARPLEVRIALLGDYDGNGRVDWCDAANWEGDRLYAGVRQPYREVVVYKIMVAREGEPSAAFTFAEILELVRTIHEISGGLPQVCYLVGWQYDGHDTGYPSLAMVNAKCGGREALVKLIRRARAYNCTISLHINYDSCYAIHPEWREDTVSRDGPGRPFVWYSKPQWGGRKVYSMNHTEDVESGFARDRLARLLRMLPLQGTIHLDAFRPYGEAWEPDGRHIDAECEVQRGIIPIIEMFRKRGLDITTEDTDDEKRGLFKWVWIQSDWRHTYKTVMNHGRLLGHGRAGLRGGKGSLAPEGVALGLGVVCEEHDGRRQASLENFYLYWMYSQVLARKKMTAYTVGDWNFGVRASYEDRTWVHGEFYPYTIEAVYEGIPMARGTDRFLPWREDVIYAYSQEGGPKEWTLPKSWKGAAVRAETLRQGGPVAGPALDIRGRTIRFLAPKGLPVRLTRRRRGPRAVL